MDQVVIGKFIARRRKAKELTQAQLAEMLNISDRAVSKWERGLNLPDPSLMLPLCEILGITADELLNGCESEAASAPEKSDEESAATETKAKNNMPIHTVISVIFSAAIAIGMLVCIICNIAVSGGLTWSLIPIASMIYAWAIVFPGLIMRKGKLTASLVSTSVFTVPYLYIMSVLTGVHMVFVIGTSAAAVSLIFLWIIAAVFIKMGKSRKRAAFGISFLLAVPFEFAMNLLLSKLIGEPIFDVWDMLTMFIFLIIAFVCFVSGKAESSST
ncbi:MAG: helix-turn-helix domain-containing protein [Oscillospiraceae bacterium]|nr:helix-turn-helix domain-containing protein [Oscillospiraceae bacterium]